MKGISPILAVVITLIIVTSIVGVGYAAYTLAALAVPVAVDYDGEFDLFVATSEGNFPTSFNVQTACNISADDDVIGEDYQSCIWRTSVNWGNVTNSTTRYFSAMIPIEDGPVEDLQIDVIPQSSGTCKPATTGSSGNEAIFIREAKIYLHEDGYPAGGAIRDLSAYIENYEVDNAVTGVLAENEYVLALEFFINNIGDDCAVGDDLYKIDLDLTTDGEAKDGHILLESS